MSGIDPLTEAKVAYADRDLVKAGELLRKMVEASDGDLETKLFLGRVLLELGKLTEARTTFLEIIKQDPVYVG